MNLWFEGCDGVELNVLDDILGDPANDDFAAELDKAAKTSGKHHTSFVLKIKFRKAMLCKFAFHQPRSN